MALLATVYTSVAKVQRFMSHAFALMASDHEEDGEPNSDVIEDAINWATEEIDMYATQRYSESGLSGSELVSRWCTLLAAYFLSQTRGNPPPAAWEEMVKRLYDNLTKIASGTLKLPGVSLRADMRPTMSNVVIDRRYRRSKARVSQANSSDPTTELTQDVANDYPGVWD